MRQNSYTFKGETLEEYETWMKQWKSSDQYQEWKKANGLYYENLTKLKKLDEKIVEYLNLHQKLDEFSKYRMIAPPQFEENSEGPQAEPLQPTKPVVKPPIPGQPEPVKITLKKKECKPDHENALKPGYVCSPQSSIWVKIDGGAGQEIMKIYPFSELKFSKGTDTSIYKVPEKPPVTEPQVAQPIVELQVTQPVVEQPITEPSKIKPAIKCKTTHVNATKPGYVCNPNTGNWVGVTGILGKKIIDETPLENLYFSTGTDISSYSTKAKPIEAASIVQPQQQLQPKVQIKQKIPVATKTEVVPSEPIIQAIAQEPKKEEVAPPTITKKEKKEQYLDAIMTDQFDRQTRNYQ